MRGHILLTKALARRCARFTWYSLEKPFVRFFISDAVVVALPRQELMVIETGQHDQWKQSPTRKGLLRSVAIGDGA